MVLRVVVVMSPRVRVKVGRDTGEKGGNGDKVMEDKNVGDD